MQIILFFAFLRNKTSYYLLTRVYIFAFYLYRLTIIQSPSSPDAGLLQTLEQDLDLGDKHARLAVFCARADHIQSGWHLIPLLDMKGKGTITGATMLVNIKVENV
jgi:hypothetical protein